MAAAAAKAALNEHDAHAESWKRDHQRVITQAENAKQQHERAAKQAMDAEIRLSDRMKNLEETRDRLARVEHDDAEEDVDSSFRDEANESLARARAREMEATLLARSTQQAVEQIAGRGAALRRQAEHEREAKARHLAAMARKRAEAELLSLIHISEPTRPAA